MTQEEEQLLIKELCARLPYNVKINIKEDYLSTMVDDILCAYHIVGISYNLESRNLRPYLRPLSSMTEEEKKDLKKEHLKDEKLYAECLTNVANGDSSMRGKVIPHFAADWCNKNHFDYRGLIEKGLALEAPEGMYK